MTTNAASRVHDDGKTSMFDFLFTFLDGLSVVVVVSCKCFFCRHELRTMSDRGAVCSLLCLSATTRQEFMTL